MRLDPGAQIELGRSRLLLLPPTWQLLHYGHWWIEIGLSPVLSYVLARHRSNLVSRIAVHNSSAAATDATRLEISLEPYAHTVLSVPPLEPGARCVLQPSAIDFDLGALEPLAERRWLPCRLRLNGEEITDTRLGVWALPANEFSFAPQDRPTLAAFVLPNHPLTTKIAADALTAHSVGAAPGTVLGSLYEHLHTSWRISYRHEPPQYDTGAQRVRLPHDVLTDPAARTGHGTCLDLALLLAGSLEVYGAQPLLAVLDLGSVYHALVGCWRQRGARLDSLPIDKDHLASEAVWVDPNGCTRDPAHRCGFDAACVRGLECLRSHPLVFALDVAVARRDGLTPLPFSGEPQWDPPAAAALANARLCATEAGRPSATVPLLIGFLQVQNGLLRRAFTQRIVDADRAATRLLAGLGPAASGAAGSRNYLAILAAAKAAAKAEGMSLILERHLITALLDARSVALDEALAALGTDRDAVRRALEDVAPGILTPSSDASLFSTRPVTS